MPLLFDVPEYKKIRVIIDTDAACEADDQFAIAQALMSPKAIVTGITAEHFNEEGSVEKSYDEIQTVLKLMEKDVPYYMGQKAAMTGTDADIENVSPAVDFIIEEARKESEHALFILCQGAITNLAVAFKKAPEIINRVTVIWVGTHGNIYGEVPFREFNAGNDIIAGNLVMQSGTNLWLVPSFVYSTIRISMAEIQRRIYPCGAIGKHLLENMIAYNHSPYAGWTHGESWSLGDSPAIALALDPQCGKCIDIHAPIIGKDTESIENEAGPMVKLYTEVDSRFILEDLIAKLEIFYGDK